MSQFPHIGKNWFAVQTRYRHEQRVAADLTTKGIEHYLPLLRELRQWKDRSRMVEVPAFSGYLFVHIDSATASRVRVLETNGVVRMLGAGSQPEAVAASEIASLQLSLTSGRTCNRHPYLSVGAPLQITRGPLSGLEGRLLRNANAFRIVVSVASIGQAIAIELSSTDVQLLDNIQNETGVSTRILPAQAPHLVPEAATREDQQVPALFRPLTQGNVPAQRFSY